MPGELQYLNLTDFTGGLNLYRNQFQLADNESPDMLNVNIDPRLGFFTRPGLIRLNATNMGGTDWDPRLAQTVILTQGNSATYIAANNTVFTSANGSDWDAMGIDAQAVPHMADFSAWAQSTYISCGPLTTAYRQDGNYAAVTNDPVALTNAEPGTFDNDYTTPSSGVFPWAEVSEPHAGYMFSANTSEDGQSFPNRLRWSHPLNPEAYAENDYIDIETGGGQITALLSYQDHLLIFKTDSMWALYGYDTQSFQLIKVSRDIGVSHPGAVCRNETAVYLFSGSDQGAVWAYNGNQPLEISEALRPMLRVCAQTPNEVWVGWAARNLFLSVPCESGTNGRAVYTWDADVGGRGAWTRFTPATCEIRCIVDRGDYIADGSPLFVVANGASAVVRTDPSLPALDYIEDQAVGVPFNVRYRTGWKDAAYPERRKSWRRPRFILSRPTAEITIAVRTFWDYDEAEQRRDHTLVVDQEGDATWRLGGADDPGGFDWDELGKDDPRGADWTAGSRAGSVIERVQPPQAGRSGLGVCAAVQLEIAVEATNNPLGVAWGVDAIVLKHRSRRGTT